MRCAPCCHVSASRRAKPEAARCGRWWRCRSISLWCGDGAMTHTDRAARTAAALTSEINVTPMIDVLLVLLIIFMAAIPSMRKSIDVQVPDPHASPPGPGSPSIVLEISANGAYSITQSAVAHDVLAPRIPERYDTRPEQVLFVKG